MTSSARDLPVGARRATYLPFAKPDITDEEISAVVSVLRSGWLTTGPEVQAFEQEFAAALGVRHAVALNSCTAAMHLALEALGVSPGDEVITSTVTFTATAEVVEYLGARSRFVDVEPGTLNLTADGVRDLIAREYVRNDGAWRHRDTGGRLRAIVPVHFGGHLADMPALVELAREYGLLMVDDAAHAFPASLGRAQVGSFGCPTAFSFYATKTVTTGEGGMLTTDDDAVASRVRLMALHGISRDAWKRYTAEGTWDYEVVAAGYKYNLTDLAAALGRVQLRRAEGMRARRAAIAAAYARGLGAVPEIELPTVRPGVVHAWHLYPIRLRLERLTIGRGEFIEELRRRQVGASVHFIPLHRQPFYRERYGYQASAFPVAEAEFPRLVSLPIYSRMSDADVASVVATVQEIIETFQR
ncbi:MAG TPA: DegT/DnrJ/EryC1/StrS aminotransferase family protein [Gemmatimonadales bacterium]|nr:DegT/DnrJ/EryC1/StrS aminotransferase family protein [Gemmatimonadales bacterium]